ncbi:MAG: alkyl sulfatase dimerization domain-containing protein [Longimicrobiales bacterium]
MKPSLKRAAVLLLLTGCSGSAQEHSRYMGGAVDLVEAPNGALVNAEILSVNSQILYLEPTVEEVTDGVWCIGGYSLANSTVIETDEGLIVYDTGDTREEAEHIRDAIAGISDKPIKVIIYSHSHYAMGGGALVDDPSDVTVIGHPMLNQTVEANLRGGGSPSAIPEVGPIMTSRVLVQFNNFLPEEGPDAAVAGKLELGKPVAFLPANRTVEDGEILDLLGLEVQFFTEFTSDDFNLTVWVPEKGLVMNNFFWPGTPNLYTLRGGVYRDPLIWRDGLKVIRDLQPEVLLNTHTRALVGREEVLRRLTGYMDQLTLTYDQTLRGILRGLGPDDLREFVQIPAHLKEIPENAQTYGETVHFPEAIYQYVIGWFDGDVTQLFKVSPREEADRLVGLMGGPAKVMAAARSAFDREEYAWGAQLIQYLYLMDPMDRDVRQLKADLLRQMAYRTTGSIPRAFLMSDALALEGKVTIPLLVSPAPEIVAGAPEVFVDYFRVRIDPVKSADEDLVLGFVFTDKADRTVALHLRGGVAEFIPEPDAYYREPDAVLRMDSDTWSALYLGTMDVAEAIEAGQVQVARGGAPEIVEAFGLFDRLDPAQNFTIPPLGS